MRPYLLQCLFVVVHKGNACSQRECGFSVGICGRPVSTGPVLHVEMPILNYLFIHSPNLDLKLEIQFVLFDFCPISPWAKSENVTSPCTRWNTKVSSLEMSDQVAWMEKFMSETTRNPARHQTATVAMETGMFCSFSIFQGTSLQTCATRSNKYFRHLDTIHPRI